MTYIIEHFAGKPWKMINFFDVNSMYVSTYKEDMPTGRGIEWVPKGNGFRKRLIAPKQISMVSIEWLEFMNHDPRFIDKNGNRQFIHHAWYGEEVKIGNYPVDGFVRVDEKTYILQFDGCIFVSINHGSSII